MNEQKILNQQQQPAAARANNSVPAITEAQLRWAQFHHKRRAVRVQKAVEELWLQPASISEVPGAIPEDGNTTEESSDSSHSGYGSSSSGSDGSNCRSPATSMSPQQHHGDGSKKGSTPRRRRERNKRRQRRPKPTISRGRRAMLRVSKRAFEERRKNILAHGFSFRSQDDEDDIDEDSNDVADDGLAAIFAEESYLKKRMRNRRQTRHCNNDDEEEERVRRFESAFRAVMMNFAAAAAGNAEPTVETPTKIWTRDETIALTLTPGMDFYCPELGWGVVPKDTTGKKSSLEALMLRYPNPTIMNTTTPIVTDMKENSQEKGDCEYASSCDKPISTPCVGGLGAELGHVVSKFTTMMADESASSTFSSPIMRGQFNNLVNLLQRKVTQPQSEKDQQPPSGNNNSKKLSQERNVPMMKLSKYFVPTKLEQFYDEKKEDDEDDEDILLAAANYYPTPVKESPLVVGVTGEKQEPQEIQILLEQMDPLLLNELEQKSSGTAERLVRRYLYKTNLDIQQGNEIEAACHQIEILANRYLAGGVEIPPPRSSKNAATNGFVSRFVAQMERAVQAHRNELILADGKLHQPSFARLLKQYLANTAEDVAPNLQQWKNSALAEQYLASAVTGGSQDNTNCGEHSPSYNNRAVSVADRFLQHLQDTMLEEDSVTLVDEDGSFCAPQFETMVTRCLVQASGQTEDSVRRAEDLVTLGISSQQDNGGGNIERYVTEADKAFVARFVDRVTDQTAGTKSLLHLEDGTLDVDAFVRLTSRSLDQATMDFSVADGGEVSCAAETEEGQPPPFCSPLALAQMRRNGAVRVRGTRQKVQQQPAFSSEIKDENADYRHNSTPQNAVRDGGNGDGNSDWCVTARSPEFLKRFLAYLKEAAEAKDNERCLITPAGTVDKCNLEWLVTRYLCAATGKKDKSNEDNGISNSSPKPPLDISRRLLLSIDCTSPVTGGRDSSASEFFQEIQLIDANESPSTNVPLRRQDEEQLIDNNSIKLPKHLQHERAITTAKMAATSMTNKVGGLMKKLYNQNDEDEVRALALFRKNRLQSTETFSDSTLSALPIGIKQVVRNFRATNLLSNGNLPPEEICNDENLEQQSIVDEMSVHSTSGDREGTELTPERIKEFNKSVMEREGLLSKMEAIDTDGSEVNSHVAGMNPEMARMLMSPTLLTKRHQQAIRSVEHRNWDQVKYLLGANPWLAEMADINTNQYLLHKLALYGAGEESVVNTTSENKPTCHSPAPDKLNNHLIRLFPSSVHKFDHDGNLPLHMAAASANLAMIRLLGDAFPSGASVRNEDGNLPLHLTILACASATKATFAVETFRAVLGYFPAAIAVGDDDGNLPLHTAVSVLTGEIGADIVYLLLDEADQQANNPTGARFRNKIHVEDCESEVSSQTTSTETPTDSSNGGDEFIYCNMVRNEHEETPLMVAIHHHAGWEIIEAIVRGSGGHQAALRQNANMDNALHLLVGEHYKDPAAALSILKVAPEAARVCNGEGILPIEIACMQMLPREVILALVLVDLPFDLDKKNNVKVRDGFGDSWWYLTCVCDDCYADVVEEVIAICSYQQVREMCFLKNASNETLISRASPKCRSVLQRALRFVGRFEFVGSSALYTDVSAGVKVFDALDFGTPSNSTNEPRRVLLKCFAREEQYMKETDFLRQHDVDFTLVEEIFTFSVGEDGGPVTDDDGPRQFCVSIERPNITLASVVDGMRGNKECQTDLNMRRRYATKMFSVLQHIARSLGYLHSIGFVHGNVSLETCGKYDDDWKLSDILGMQRVGQHFEPGRFSQSASPETIEPLSNALVDQYNFRTDVITHPCIDVWAFGKLAFEALVGESLIAFEDNNERDQSQEGAALMKTMRWNDFDLEGVRQKTRRAGVSKIASDLITQCLSPETDDRPSMEEISHSLWKESQASTATASRMPEESDGGSSFGEIHEI